MFKIMKYDFIRKFRLFAIAMVTAVIINLLLIFNYKSDGSAIFIGLFPVALSILYMIDIIRMYSEDLNKKSGYMLFMTPNSGYHIVISKVMTAIVEGVAAVIIISVISVLNALYIAIYHGYKIEANFFEELNYLLTNAVGINFGHILLIMFAMLLMFITFILTCYTAITIRKSIFSEIKLGGLFSFGIFIALNWGISTIVNKLSNLFEPAYSNWLNSWMNYSSYNYNPSVGEMFMVLLPSLLFMAVFCTAMTAACGYLLERKINL